MRRVPGRWATGEGRGAVREALPTVGRQAGGSGRVVVDGNRWAARTDSWRVP
jgi:hypothetical protein